jgi:hypothetical protein
VSNRASNRRRDDIVSLRLERDDLREGVLAFPPAHGPQETRASNSQPRSAATRRRSRNGRGSASSPSRKNASRTASSSTTATRCAALSLRGKAGRRPRVAPRRRSA